MTYSAFHPNQWIKLYRQLNIKGIVQSTAANSICVGKEESTLYFLLDSVKASLFDTSHQSRLSALLSDYFGVDVQVSIDVGDIPDGVETPSECDAREEKERKMAALEDFTADPGVQKIINTFDAVLNEASVDVKTTH